MPDVVSRDKREASGNKYHRLIRGLAAYASEVLPTRCVKIDVYSVIRAFAVTCPALQHAVKKILCAGIRGKGGRLQDLLEARDALDRAIEDCMEDEMRPHD